MNEKFIKMALIENVTDASLIIFLLYGLALH